MLLGEYKAWLLSGSPGFKLSWTHLHCGSGRGTSPTTSVLPMKQPQDEYYLRLSKENVFTFILNLIGTSLSLAAYQHYPSNIQGIRTNNLHYHIPLPHTCSSILSPVPLCTSHPASTPSMISWREKIQRINQSALLGAVLDMLIDRCAILSSLLGFLATAFAFS